VMSMVGLYYYLRPSLPCTSARWREGATPESSRWFRPLKRRTKTHKDTDNFLCH
jgi:hypothetical protein